MSQTIVLNLYVCFAILLNNSHGSTQYQKIPNRRERFCNSYFLAHTEQELCVDSKPVWQYQKCYLGVALCCRPGLTPNDSVDALLSVFP